jgi:hypothetical protein
MEVEHIQAISNGGYDGKANYAAVCRSCNASKGNKDVDEYCAGGVCKIDPNRLRVHAKIHAQAAPSARFGK